MNGSPRELEILKAALDKTHIISITDAQGIIQYVNEKFCLLTKYSREELIGSDHRIINSGHHSKEFIADLWKTISSGSIWTQQIKNKDKDNSFFWLDTSIIPFTDENGNLLSHFSISQNITKQKQEEKRTTQFFELSQDYLCIIDHTGRFEKVSPVFLKVLGLPLEELQLTPYSEFQGRRRQFMLSFTYRLNQKRTTQIQRIHLMRNSDHFDFFEQSLPVSNFFLMQP